MTVVSNDHRFQPINLFEYEKLAKEHLSQMTLDYYSSGAWDEITLRDNCAAFERIKLKPRILVDVSDVYDGLRLRNLILYYHAWRKTLS
jgi:4-hydroxymandelate oxidase